MKIYGIDVSFPTNKVRYAANAMGLSYEFVHIMPFSPEAEAPDYRAKHPVGKVPVLEEDDGFSVFESNAIIRYLAVTHNSELYPADPRQRAVIDQWMDFASIHVGGAIARVFWNTIGVKFMNEEPDTNSLAAGHGFLDRFLPALDAQLADSAYMAGDALSLADFAALAPLDPADIIGVGLSQYANLSRWRADMQSRDWYQVDRSFGQQLISGLLAQS
ncbi:MAG: glutathione S-transferase [Rhodothermales bacterium]|jgi:glutathione S-transferase